MGIRNLETAVESQRDAGSTLSRRSGRHWQRKLTESSAPRWSVSATHDSSLVLHQRTIGNLIRSSLISRPDSMSRFNQTERGHAALVAAVKA